MCEYMYEVGGGGDGGGGLEVVPMALARLLCVLPSKLRGAWEIGTSICRCPDHATAC